jgi:hypothetical protein
MFLGSTCGGLYSQRRILAGVFGKTDSKRAALDLLIVDGYVTEKWGSPAFLVALDLGLIGPGRS